MSPRIPNLFELHRGGVDITYSASGIDGKPRLHYQNRERHLDFTGEQVETGESEIGRWVKVELSFGRGGESRVLTVLLPQVHLPADHPDVRLKALVVLTTVRPAPEDHDGLSGPLQTYSARTYRGTARAVDF